MKLLNLILRRAILAAVLTVISAGLLWQTGALVWMATKAAELVSKGRVFDDPAKAGTNDLGLVLGTSIRGQLLKQRVATAAALYRAGKVKHLLLSGDGRTASYHEPRAMRSMLAALGVPQEAMTEDAAGLTTYESVQHAQALAKGSTFVIVSQPAHCRRAILLTRGLGGDAVAVAATQSSGTSEISRHEQWASVRALLDLIGLRSVTSLLAQA